MLELYGDYGNIQVLKYRMEKRNIKRVYASLILFTLIIIIISLIMYFLFPRLVHQIKDIGESVPELVDKVYVYFQVQYLLYHVQHYH